MDLIGKVLPGGGLWDPRTMLGTLCPPSPKEVWYVGEEKNHWMSEQLFIWQNLPTCSDESNFIIATLSLPFYTEFPVHVAP